ncbi:MAG: inner membrane CreD family protein [Verrucomicrobiota bacterium]
MPGVLNPGPVASRIAFFAPVSLIFFFAVLLIMATVWQVNLHPMNYFFLAAGLFAFHLLFAYLVDLIPLTAAFVVAALVSMVLVSGYLFIAAGKAFARLAASAQFAYLVLFSYSFFFDGLTGLTITLGAIITLAILMVTTARVDWSEKFTR